MKYSVLGIEDVNYTNKQGNEVSGLRLHLVNEQLQRNNLRGNAVEQIFISARADCFPTAKKLEINSYCEPIYNRYGSIEDIIPIE